MKLMQRPRKKRLWATEGEIIPFEAGRVFSPAEAKVDDFELDLEAARYAARKGQGGDRR